MKLRYLALSFVCALGVHVPTPVAAQIRASELGSLTQVIDGTKISITYSRPRTRGRAKLFGTSAAHWGETWTPGANWATTFEVNKDVTLNGKAIPKGKYSVWMILRETGEWTTVLDPDWHRFHMEPPDSTPKQYRVPTNVEQAPFLDVLTWSMPDLSAGGGTIAMQWGTTRATMHIDVKPSLVVTMAEADAQPYIGEWTYIEKETGKPDVVKQFIMTYEQGTLKAHWIPKDEYMETFAMIRVAPDVFTAGLYDKDGKIYEVLRPDMMFTFKRVAGKPATLEVRGEADELYATAKRTP